MIFFYFIYIKRLLQLLPLQNLQTPQILVFLFFVSIAQYTLSHNNVSKHAEANRGQTKH